MRRGSVQLKTTLKTCKINNKSNTNLDGHLVSKHKVRRGSVQLKTTLQTCKINNESNTNLDGHLVSKRQVRRGSVQLKTTLKTSKINNKSIPDRKVSFQEQEQQPVMNGTLEPIVPPSSVHRKPITVKDKPVPPVLRRCPLCPALVQRLDGHLVSKHKMRRGSVQLKTTLKTCKINNKSIPDRKVSFQEQEQQPVMNGTIEPIVPPSIHSMPITVKDKPVPPVLQRCPSCPALVQRLDGHLVSKHKMFRGSVQWKTTLKPCKINNKSVPASQVSFEEQQQQPVVNETMEPDVPPSSIHFSAEEMSRLQQQMQQTELVQLAGIKEGGVGSTQTQGVSGSKSSFSSCNLAEALERVLDVDNEEYREKEEHKEKRNSSEDQHEQPIEKKRQTITRTCSICDVKTDRMGQHLKRKHANLSAEEQSEARRQMVESQPITRQSGPVKLKTCPYQDCKALVQRLDTHLNKRHNLEWGSSQMSSCMREAQATQAGEKSDETKRAESPEGQQEQNKKSKSKRRRISRMCVICHKEINHMSRHFAREHQNLSEERIRKARATMILRKPITRTDRKPNPLVLMRCPFCPVLAQRLCGHLALKHKISKGSEEMRNILKTCWKSNQEESEESDCSQETEAAESERAGRLGDLEDHNDILKEVHQTDTFQSQFSEFLFRNKNAVKPVYSDHLWPGTRKVATVDR